MGDRRGMGEVAFLRGGRSYNSLPRHLPSTYSVPYGFKLDLDFIRFCDTYYENKDGGQRPASRLRRARKSHKKSYDTLLGLRKEKSDREKEFSPPVKTSTVHQLCTSPSRRSISSPPVDNRLASELEHSLGEVMSDFEDALQRSRHHRYNSAYLSDSARYVPLTRRYHSLPRTASLTGMRRSQDGSLERTSSTSSLSSTDSGPSRPDDDAARQRSSDINREMLETINSLQKLSQMDDLELRLPTAASVAAARSKRTQSPHRRKSREASVDRIRDLEEQVKAIPALKKTISVLREEKEALERRVKAGRSPVRHERSPEAAAGSSTGQIRPSLRSRSLSPAQGVAAVWRVQQDASTSCRVLTRDVGVCGDPKPRGRTPPKEAPTNRSVGVATDHVTPEPRTLTRDVGVVTCREAISNKTVGVLTDITLVEGDAGRRKVSLESILSGRGGCRSVAVGTTRPQLTVSRTNVEHVVTERPRRERGAQTTCPGLVSTSTETERPAKRRDVSCATDLSQDRLLDAERLQLQLDELRELSRGSRSSSETRDTFTQIKEYELGVNYVRGAFAFVKSADRGVQVDAPISARRNCAVQVELVMSVTPPPVVPVVLTRSFAAQVRPAVDSAAVQCVGETRSRGVTARPDTAEVAVTAALRPAGRTVASGADQPVTVGAQQRLTRRLDVACTALPDTLSRGVNTDKPRQPLKKVKATLTDVTPLRSVASGEHLVTRQQTCQTDPPSPSPPLTAGRESPLPPLPRAAGSRIPRLATPPTARRQIPPSPSATPPARRRAPPTPEPPPTAEPKQRQFGRRDTYVAHSPSQISQLTAGTGSEHGQGDTLLMKFTAASEVKSPKQNSSNVPTSSAKGDSEIPDSNGTLTLVKAQTETLVKNVMSDGLKKLEMETPEVKSKVSAPLAEEDRFSSEEEAHPTSEKAATPPPHVKVSPSAEMSAALKVLNDWLTSGTRTQMTSAVTSALVLVQSEWFKMAGSREADPLQVEDYLDAFEQISHKLLHTVVNLADNNGNTAMHYAVSHGKFDVISVLLDSKVCDVQRPNNAGYTCIMLLSLAQIASDTHRQVVRRLLKNANVNLRAKQHGQTALMLAVSHGRLDMVNLLLEAGADLNIQDDDGSTALMCAAEHGHLNIVRLLIGQRECDPEITDSDGCTALQVAMEAGHRDVGLLLYAHANFSRTSSPFGSLRRKRPSSRTSTPTGRASATPPYTTPTGTPGLGRRSHSSLH